MFSESYKEVEDSEKNWHLHTPWLELVSVHLGWVAVAGGLRQWKSEVAGSRYSVCGAGCFYWLPHLQRKLMGSERTPNLNNDAA